MTVHEQIEKLGVLPVIVIDDAASAAPLADALLAGGVNAAEITMRTAAGRDAIAAMAKAHPEMLVGAGTVLTAEAAEEAIAAGSRFIVSPGLNPAVAAVCKAHGVDYLPGVVTPTEIDQALALGLTWLKFFPASAFGGAKTIKALAAPYTMVRFMPTGGVSNDNLEDYLKLPCIFACGASFLAERSLIAAGDRAEITARCRAAVEKVQAIRG